MELTQRASVSRGGVVDDVGKGCRKVGGPSVQAR